MTTVTHKTIVVFIPALDVEVDVQRNPNASVQNGSVPEVGDIATAKVVLDGGDYAATAATFVREFGIDLNKEKILWTDRKRHTIFSLPLSFTKYTLTETKLIIQRGCFNLREDEIQLYRVRDIAFKQNFYERLCRVGSIHLCSTDAMTPEIDIRRIKNPRDVKEVLSKTIEACRKANGIRTSEIIGDHGRFPEPDPHGMPPEPCHEHPHD